MKMTDKLQVGDFELEASDLFDITAAFTRGEAIDRIAERLDLDLSELAELLSHPEVFEQAIEAKKQLIRLLIYGPIADSMTTVASGLGDARSRVSAAKFLLDLVQDGKSTAPEDHTPTVPGAQVIQQFFLNEEGSYDRLMRNMALGAQKPDTKVLIASSVEV